MFSTPAIAEEDALPSQADTIKIINIPDYISPKLLQDFTDQTGFKVDYHTQYSNSKEILNHLKQQAHYDIAILSHTEIIEAIQSQLLQPLDITKLPYLKTGWEPIQERLNQITDIDRYSANYLWGTLGMAVNMRLIEKRLPKQDVYSLRLLFDPKVLKKVADCGVYLPDDPDIVVPLILQYLGKNPNNMTTDDLLDIERVLITISPHLQYSDEKTIIKRMARQEICVAVGRSGDFVKLQTMLKQIGIPSSTIAFFLPEDGGLLWFDQMVIPRSATNPNAAHAFINFMNKPENHAELTRFLAYPTMNIAARRLLDKNLLNNPAIYPQKEILDHLYYVTQLLPPVISSELNKLWIKLRFELSKYH